MTETKKAEVFAFLHNQEDSVAFVQYQGVCWPVLSIHSAKHYAKVFKCFGFWRIKPKANV